MNADTASQIGIADAIGRFGAVHVVVVGDVMLDRFIYGGTTRISPEAPVPVIAKTRADAMPGGAANVAMNLLAYGCRVTLAGVCGDDSDGKELKALCAQNARLTTQLIADEHRPTTVKTRIIAQAQQMMRLDTEASAALDDAVAGELVKQVTPELNRAGALILSDYAKGVLTDGVCEALIRAAREADVPVLVDPKRTGLSAYSGATLISPNAGEMRQITGHAMADDGDAAQACAALLAANPQIGAVLATRGNAGMTLLERGGEAVHVPAQARSVFDVSGAGDTVIATIAAGLAAGLALADTVRLGNAAAGVAISKAGTSTVAPEELLEALHIDAPHRPMGRERAAALAARWRGEGLRVGFTNGCFDLLHAGHLHSLEYARARCDALVVGVNSDRSVRALKGDNRPMQDEETRARLLASLQFCDAVTVFDEDTPFELITAVQPDVLFKGADYAEADVVGGDVVRERGGVITLVPLLDGHSTSALVDRFSKS